MIDWKNKKEKALEEKLAQFEVERLDDVWRSRDDAAVQLVIDAHIFTGYLVEKAIAKAEIDRMAGETRKRFMTSVPGQESVYAEKAREADGWSVAGKPATANAAYPHLEEEAALSAISLTEVAENVLATRDIWQGVLSPKIEGIRMASKRAVGLGSTPQEIVTLIVTAKADFDLVGV